MAGRRKSARIAAANTTTESSSANVSICVRINRTNRTASQSSIKLGTAVESGPTSKRRKTLGIISSATTTTTSNSITDSSTHSVCSSGEDISTPATSISADSFSTNHAILNKLSSDEATRRRTTAPRRSTRLSQIIQAVTDSEEDDDEQDNKEETDDVSEADEFEPTDVDEIASEAEDEVVKQMKGKGKEKATSSTYTSHTVHTRTRSREAAVSAGQESFIDLQGDVEQEEEEEEEEQEELLDAPSDMDLGEDVGPVLNRRLHHQNFVYPMSRSERSLQRLYMWHPELRSIWADLRKRKRIEIQQDPQPDGLTLTMLPFQLEGLFWLRNQEKTEFRGGILADEMGMGKTIQTIALLMAEPRCKPNLVVAPTVALMQWRNEIEKHTANALSVIVFHGANRSGDIKVLQNCNVLMTTYSVLESLYRKQQYGFKRKDGLVKEDSVLHKIHFHRVILDEAHNIKDRTCNTAKAVFALKTKYKLCLTGTPLQNRIGEFFSLLRFLEADPFAYYFCRQCACKSLHWKFTDNKSCDSCHHRPMDHCAWFNTELLRPIQQYGGTGTGKLAFEKLREILGYLMLRRTKVEKADDLGLPPRIVKIRRDFFNEEELDLYDSIYGESRRKFDTYVAQGVVLNNYANIFTLLTRMRQLADHPDLVLRKHTEEGQNILVCCICDDEAEDAIVSKCHHKFCRMCVTKYIDGYDGNDAPDCPQCHISLSIDLTQPAIEDFSNVKRGSIINRIDMHNWRSSTKIEALVEELYKLRSKTQTIKSIVFSQFTSMLQLVEWRLRRGGFQTVMLEGSMSPPQRDAVIKHFMETPLVEVFLVSLKAGGVALNLTEASQVFILDPWWNPSVEWQSGDRVHRIGQKRSCKITRLVIEDSIESKIIELQEKKARMIEATVNGDQKSMDKLTPADMQFLFQN